MTTVEKLCRTVRAGIDRTIADAVAATRPHAFTTRPAFPGAQTMLRVPEPLAALGPAILAELDARHAARELAARAREDGATWHHIALAAGIAPSLPDYERGYHAWAWAAGYEASAQTTGEDHGYGYDRSVGWRCNTCHRMILDYGPDGGHPADAERGHGRGCARHRAAIDLHERSLDDD